MQGAVLLLLLLLLLIIIIRREKEGLRPVLKNWHRGVERSLDVFLREMKQ